MIKSFLKVWYAGGLMPLTLQIMEWRGEMTMNGKTSPRGAGAIKIAPSLLAADFLDLGGEIRRMEAAGADMLHFDVMDGVFVPNLTFGPPVLKAVRRAADVPLDVHLMISDAGRYIGAFAEAGADIITLHREAFGKAELTAALREIKRLGLRASVSVSPGTPVEELFGFIGEASMALVMTVRPGFGGQRLMPETLGKISALRRFIDDGGCGCDCEIEADGGINGQNAASVVSAGADVLVIGTAAFGSPDPAALFGGIKRAADA